MASLPVESCLPSLAQHLLAWPNAVLVAPPGAGKTTRVPLAMRDAPWLDGRKILMLEPRRLAARAAAHWMANQVGDGVGATVGYRMRLDTRTGPRTVIEVVTEGILTRLLQDDPALSAYGIVIFDEFHERSLQADLGLALSLESQRLFRPDLRLLVMSATLEAGPVAALLGEARVFTVDGRQYPVEVRYREPPRSNVSARADAVVETIRELLTSDAGNLLVFLPGMAEIRRTDRKLRERGLPSNVLVTPLHGDLSLEEQERAIRPAADGTRKVVLSSAVAESSLTIEDVRVVVDVGLMRVPRYDPRTGLTRLQTVRVTQDAAEQRRGRAGRLQPGLCVRLWTPAEHRTLLPRRSPEILEADLATMLLELAAWGAPDPSELSWLDRPPAAALASARALLTQLGALDAGGSITPHGRRLATLGLHPRLAHMVVRGAQLGYARLSCELAALLSDRDPLGDRSADLRLRLDALGDRLARQGGGSGSLGMGEDLDQGRLRRVRDLSRLIARGLQQLDDSDSRQRRVEVAPTSNTDFGPAPQAREGAIGLLLAFAYPDRIAQRQAGGHYRLANGRGAVLAGADSLGSHDYLVIAELGDGEPWARINLAAPVTLEDLEQHHGHLIVEHESTQWDDRQGSLRVRQERRLGAIVLRERLGGTASGDLARAALLASLRQTGLSLLPWTEALRQWQARVAFLRHLDTRPEPFRWPDVSDETLLATLEDWLTPWLDGLTALEELQRLDLAGALQALVPAPRRQELDRLAPTSVLVPSGSRVRLDYRQGEQPVLAVRLQELFGMEETPSVVDGRVPVMLHLLSPAGRPVQITRDLRSFWKSGYQQVRKELRARYPKHDWPEDPLSAPPTRGASRSRRRGITR